LTDFPEFLKNFDLAVGSWINKPLAALDHLVCRYIRSASVGVGERLNVALVDQPAVRLPRADVTEVVQDLVPKSRIQQVQHRVFGAADVQVDAAGIVRAVLSRPWTHPVGLIFLGAEPF